MARIVSGWSMAALLLAGCGYVGNPLPPLANVPARVSGLAAVERGARIIVHFQLPEVTTENVAIKGPLKLDLRIGPAPEGPFRAADWELRAQPAPPGEVEGRNATFTIPTAPWTGQTVIIAARVTGANGKASDWSALDAFPVVAPPPKPAAPAVENTADGLRLTWNGPAGDFRVFRRTAGEKTFSPVAEVQGLTWTDTTTEFGKQYTYLVQRIVKLGIRREAESDPSPETSGTAEDRFPPAVPVGLRVSAAAASIELSWDRNTEPDLGGYRVYRATGSGAFEKLADVSQIPSYSDRAVKSGERYRYVITAVDKAGNESARSAAAEAAIE